MYLLVHKKQGRSKTKLPNILKWSRTEAARKTIQLLDITVATSYQDATIRKIYNYCAGSSGLEIGTIKYQKPCVACKDKSTFATIHRAALV